MNPTFLYVNLADIDQPCENQALDGFEMFVLTHSEFPTSENLPPIRGQFDSQKNLFVPIPEDVEVSKKVLRMARAIGLSTLPFLLFGASPKSGNYAEAAMQKSAKFQDFRHSDALYGLIHKETKKLAKKRQNRTSKNILRISDHEVWAQEATFALFKEGKRANQRLRDRVAVTRYVHGVISKQVARSAKRGCACGELFPNAVPPGREKTPCEKIIERECQSAILALESQIAATENQLNTALDSIPASTAQALRAWLNGLGMKRAGAPHKQTLAMMRTAIRRLKDSARPLGKMLKTVRENLLAIRWVDRFRATEISLGRLGRLMIQRKRKKGSPSAKRGGSEIIP